MRNEDERERKRDGAIDLGIRVSMSVGTREV